LHAHVVLNNPLTSCIAPTLLRLILHPPSYVLYAAEVCYLHLTSSDVVVIILEGIGWWVLAYISWKRTWYSLARGSWNTARLHLATASLSTVQPRLAELNNSLQNGVRGSLLQEDNITHNTSFCTPTKKAVLTEQKLKGQFCYISLF